MPAAYLELRSLCFLPVPTPPTGETTKYLAAVGATKDQDTAPEADLVCPSPVKRPGSI